MQDMMLGDGPDFGWFMKQLRRGEAEINGMQVWLTAG